MSPEQVSKTPNQDNNYSTPAFVRLGFRPFFFAAGVSAVLAMIMWVLFYPSIITIENTTPSYWHAHEMVFAYSATVAVGFLLTASRNWTGVQTIYDKPLLGLFLLWAAGRFLPFVNNEYLIYQAIIDSSFLVIATIAISYPIIKGKAWSNVSIIAKILLLAVANILYYLGLLGELEQGAYFGIYLGFYLIISLLFMMSRRLLPFFIERGIGLSQELPNSKLLDLLSLFLFLAFIVIEVFFNSLVSAIIASVLFVIHLIRMINWYHPKIWQKSLLWSIYTAYGFLTLGFALNALKHFVSFAPNIDIHSFAFGVALMTLSLMSRITLGHTGRNVFDPPKQLNIIFILLVLAFVFRVVIASINIENYTQWILVSQILWIVSFSAFLAIYAPMFFKARVDGQFG